MVKQNYKRSRHLSIQALKLVNEIKKEYPQCPVACNLSKEKIAWLNLQIQKIEESIIQIGYKGFIFFQQFREDRNKLAHATKEITEEENNKRWSSFFNNMNQCQAELEKNIARLFSKNKTVRQYEKFASAEIGTELERKQSVNAIEDVLNQDIVNNEKVSFPNTKYMQEAKKILEPQTPDGKNLLVYAQKHNQIKSSILIDMIEWITKTQHKIFTENPFKDEENFIKELSTKNNTIFDSNKVKELKTNYDTLFSVCEKTRGNILSSSVDFSFYDKKLKKQEEDYAEVKKQSSLLFQQEEHLKTLDKDLKNKELSKSERQLIKKEYKNIKTQVFSLKNYLSILEKKQKIPQELINDASILLRNLQKDIEESYIKRKNAWELEQLEKVRKEFMQTLYEKIARFKKLEQVLSPFIDNLGHLWDMSNTPFQDNGFEILKTYADLLENDEFLIELAKLLGRQGHEQIKYEKELRDKIEIVTEYIPKPAFRGEIAGLRLSNDVSIVVPSELALYKNPKTKKYFMLKFAQQQLLSYAYERDQIYLKEKIVQEEIDIKKSNTKPKGPIIICIDTSGSMSGVPERIAKTVAFALTKIAINEKRNCYLISFSTGIETLDLSSFIGANALSNLVQFLRMSFNGGTDATPALEHAITLLHKNDWKNSDLLMISDFIMQDLSENLKTKIIAEQKTGTGFYSLVIGQSGNTQAIKNFDANWNYNPNDKNAQRQLVQQLDKLKKRKTN